MRVLHESVALAGVSGLPHVESPAVIELLLSNVQFRQPVCPWRAQVQGRTLVSLAGFLSLRETWPQLRRARLAEHLARSQLARQSAIPFPLREARRCPHRAQHTHARALRNR